MTHGDPRGSAPLGTKQWPLAPRHSAPIPVRLPPRGPPISQCPAFGLVGVCPLVSDQRARGPAYYLSMTPTRCATPPNYAKRPDLTVTAWVGSACIAVAGGLRGHGVDGHTEHAESASYDAGHRERGASAAATSEGLDCGRTAPCRKIGTGLGMRWHEMGVGAWPCA